MSAPPRVLGLGGSMAGLTALWTFHRITGDENSSPEVMAKIPEESWNERSNYRLTARPFKAGGQADIHAATFKPTGAEVAFKKFRAARGSRGALRAQREIGCLRDLSASPGVISLLGYDSIGGLWYAMPLAAGDMWSLRAQIEEDDLLAIMENVMSGLDSAHARGFVHRDLNPKNILRLDSKSGRRWVLADWGLVKAPPGEEVQRHTVAGTGVGTAGFISPEAYSDAHLVGPAADLYGLGRVAAWALTGQNPVPNLPLIPDGRWSDFVARTTDASPSSRLDLLGSRGMVDVLRARLGSEDIPDHVNAESAAVLGELSERLEEAGFRGEDLHRLLVRLLFCFFADDAGLFESDLFADWIRHHTEASGADLGHKLAHLFQVLATPVDERMSGLSEALSAFPYVNGGLFDQRGRIASFDPVCRDLILTCCDFDWARVSPEIFGALFQSVIDPKVRRQGGAHYTAEREILKAIGPLFLDGLCASFDKAVGSARRLERLHSAVAKINLLDPACGCGNFLVVAYRELRKLELRILQELHRDQARVLDIGLLTKVRLSAMAGIELESFPALVAEVALWLVDHQMNMELSRQFGGYFVRLPLEDGPRISSGNALKMDWSLYVDGQEGAYVVGNPPFVGKQLQTPKQKADMAAVFGKAAGFKKLDYVSAWYRKAVDLMSACPLVRTAFVSTSSIAEGEQPGVLWRALEEVGPWEIDFAHRRFEWGSDAAQAASVHVVIIGFGAPRSGPRSLYSYPLSKGEAQLRVVSHINSHLSHSKAPGLSTRRRPISDVPAMVYGSKPADGGGLLLSAEEAEQLRSNAPAGSVRPYLTAHNALRRTDRFCLWLEGMSLEELEPWPQVMERVERVRARRAASSKASTRASAETPHLFTENRQPQSDYLVVPVHSSHRRLCIPIRYEPAATIASNAVFFLPSDDLYLFGILSSEMHMVWTRGVGGRLKSDLRYSNTLVYNNFLFPDDASLEVRDSVRDAAQRVLDVRASCADQTLEQLYEPDGMPVELLNAHKGLDCVVDAAYGVAGFSSEIHRLDHLIQLHKARVLEES